MIVIFFCDSMILRGREFSRIVRKCCTQKRTVWLSMLDVSALAQWALIFSFLIIRVDYVSAVDRLDLVEARSTLP